MNIDPVTIEVVASRLREAASTMEHALYHSGYSPILRESKDGTSGLTDKAGRVANEGIVEAYVHGGGVSGQKLGVLIEVNCESDFVAKTDDFKQLARELALQVAGAAPLFVRREDVPPVTVERERAVFRAQITDKPANIQDKIIEGKLNAFFSQICLLEQPFAREQIGAEIDQQRADGHAEHRHADGEKGQVVIGDDRNDPGFYNLQHQAAHTDEKHAKKKRGGAAT